MEQVIEKKEVVQKPIKQKNYCLAFFEALACIMIIFIHTSFPGDFGFFMQTLGRFGVPLFFAISGFFLYKEGITKEETRAKLKKRIIHIFCLLIFSFVLGFIFELLVASFSKDGEGARAFFANHFNWNKLLYFAVFNRPFVNGKNWFLIAMLVSYVFIYCFPNLFIKNKWFIYVLPAMLLFWYVFRVVIIFTSPNISILGLNIKTSFFYVTWYNNGLLSITFGILIKKNIGKLSRIPVKFVLIGLFFSVALMVTEMFLLKKLSGTNTSFCVGNFLCVLFILILCAEKPQWFSSWKILNIDGQWTTYVYIFHPLLITTFKLVLNNTSLTTNAKRCIIPPAVVISSVLLAIGFTYLLKFVKSKLNKPKEALC